MVTPVKSNKMEKILDYLAFVDISFLFVENNIAVNLNEERFGLAFLAMSCMILFFDSASDNVKIGDLAARFYSEI